MDNKYYIYFHINPLKNEIFYVGKGHGRRAYRKDGRSQFWSRTINKYGYIIDIIETGLSNEEASEKEKWYIKRIGRRDLGLGPLVNHTDGGEGTIGRTPWNKGGTSWSKGLTQTKESIAKRVLKTTGKKRTEEQNIKNSERMKGKTPWNKGKSLSDEQKRINKLASSKKYRDANKTKTK